TDALSAIVAWRGMLLPVIDLHGLLGLRHGEPSDERRLVVIGGQTASRAFVADEVEGIEEDDAPVGPVPPGVAAAGPFVQGMRGTTLVLDAERLLGLEPFGG